jgi:microsomal epoxide hydrolase
MQEPRFETISGLTVRLQTCGSGPTVVLVPGWPQSLYAWRKIIPRLAGRYHVIAFDPPGLGDTDPLPGGHDVTGVAAFVRAVLDHLGVDDYFYVGHDIGTWIGYALAASDPRGMRSLTVIDAALPGLAPAAAFALAPERVEKVWHFYFNALPGLPEMLIRGREREYLEWLFRSRSVHPDAAFAPEDIDEYARSYRRPEILAAGFDYYRSIFKSMEQNRAFARTKVKMPVLAIGAEKFLGAAMAATFEPLAETLIGRVIPDCGHYLLEEAPGPLADLLIDFFCEPARVSRQ